MPFCSLSGLPCRPAIAPSATLPVDVQARFVQRRLFIGRAIGLTAVAALAQPWLAVAQPRPEKSRITLAVGGKPALGHLPLTIAEQLGYFKAEGLEVEISDVDTSARVQQALANGTADIGADFYEQILHPQAKGQTLKAFVLQSRAPLVAFGVSSKTLPGYKTTADLQGRTVGISDTDFAPASLLVSRILTRAGLQTDKVKFVGLPSTAAALSALRSGQIDAICHSDPVMTLLEQKSEVKIIGDTRTLKGTADIYGGALACACLMASEAFMQKNPAICQALANAIVHALKWMQTAGPGDMVKTVPEGYLMGDRALYLAAFSKMRETISPDGILREDAARTTLRTLASFDASIAPDKISLGKTYTNEFALRAKERFKA